jgi:hypothetical protein
MLKSTIALIKDDISLRRYFKAFSFSMNNLVKTKTFKWEEWPPPKQYQGFLPPINVKDIKDLIGTKKVDYDFVDVDIDEFLPNYKYQSRKELLDLIQKYGLNEKKRRTYLFRSKGAKRCNQIELLYRNIIQFGFRDYENDSKDRNWELPPCYIDMPDIGIRVDGTNRAAILKFLGHKQIRALRIKADDLFGVKLPGDGRNTSGNMRMNIIKHWFLPYAKIKGIKVKISKNIFSSNWYQDIELAPGVYTHSKKHQQTDLWIKNTPDLTGRKMIDLGTNCGNYAFSAIDKGAKKVLGLEISKRDFERAKFAQSIKLINNDAYKNIIFKRLNILDNMNLLDGYNTFCASNVLYLLGPDVNDLFQAIEKSDIDLLILQGQLRRKYRIGEYNKSGVKGYEEKNKTWGNILGTIEGLINLATMNKFKIEKIYESSNWPLIIARR